MSKKTRTSYLFLFQDEDSANEFLTFARSLPNVKDAFHPYSSDGSGCYEPTRVQVLGCDSLAINASLVEKLMAHSTNLNGFRWLNS